MRRDPLGYSAGYGTQPPFHTVGFAPAPSKPQRTGLIVAGSVVAAIAVLTVIGALLPDDAKDDKAAGGGSSASGSPDGTRPRTDPKPVSYKNIDVTANYSVLLADNPPRPAKDASGVLYGKGDLYYFYDEMFGDEQLGTANGKLVLLNNSQKGSLETCRSETRYTEKIGLDQLTNGSQICVLSDAGHIAVATYRSRSGAKDPSRYFTLDLTIWRNAEDPRESQAVSARGARQVRYEGGTALSAVTRGRRMSACPFDAHLCRTRCPSGVGAQGKSEPSQRVTP